MESLHGIILLDVPEGTGQAQVTALEGMGHAVTICHGPDAKTLCPILKRGGHCDMVTGAHGIVFELDLDRPQHRAILRRYQEVVKTGIPIRALVSAEQADRYRDLLTGIDVWTHEPGAGDLDAFSARVEGYRRVSED
ncbi:MAG: hypothetical protein BMS9Abin07_1266 [Acidimicrobiia bacterium]|nr:MAG: hypothetical protein BMS9Abin07_1266 [Acidimicrobiia bacterium]